MTDAYDLALIGNFGRNEMHHFDGTTEPIIGGPVAQCALATSWSDKRVAVVTRMAESDTGLLEPLTKAGMRVSSLRSRRPRRSHIFYLSEDVENRRHVLEKSAGPFSLADVSVVEARLIHLVGVNRLEYPLAFMLDLKRNGMPFSIDMQALVRAANPETGEVIYCDYPHKRQVAAIAEKAKLDAVKPSSSPGLPTWSGPLCSSSNGGPQKSW